MTAWRANHFYTSKLFKTISVLFFTEAFILFVPVNSNGFRSLVPMYHLNEAFKS